MKNFQQLLADCNEYDTDINSVHTFINACRNGNLDMCIWLHGLNNYSITDINHAFRNACENGHIDVCKWLHGLNNK